MPQQAWSDKRERQYEHIEESLEERGTREISQWPLLGDIKRGVSDVTCEPGQAVYASTDFSTKSFAQVCSGIVDGKGHIYLKRMLGTFKNDDTWL